LLNLNRYLLYKEKPAIASLAAATKDPAVAKIVAASLLSPF
jgi:hypothetical protein